MSDTDTDTGTDATAPEPEDADTYRRQPDAHLQPGGHRLSGTSGQRCIRRAVPEPGRVETVTPAPGSGTGAVGPAGSPARGRSGRPATPRGGRGPGPAHRPGPSPAHPARSPRPVRPVRPARPGGWQIERVDTVPMTADEHSAAVNALAVLITAWTQQAHDDGEPAAKAT